MSDNGTKPKQYLKTYTDEEMVYEALATYAMNRHLFAKAIAEKGYTNRDGKAPTIEEINFAWDAAEQASRLAHYAKEKVDSPIIQLQ